MKLFKKINLLRSQKKESVYYKNKITNKAIDILLNYIFPKNKDKTRIIDHI